MNDFDILSAPLDAGPPKPRGTKSLGEAIACK